MYFVSVFLFHIIGGDLRALGLSVLFNDIYTSSIYNTYCYMVDTQQIAKRGRKKGSQVGLMKMLSLSALPASL